MLWLPESPALFYERGDFEKAKDVVRRIASVNGSKDLPEKFRYDSEVHKVESLQDAPSTIDFLRYTPILINFIVLVILFCSCSFDNYLIGFYMKYVGGNIFVNKMSRAFASMVARVAGTLIERFFGLKWAWKISLLIVLIAPIPLFFIKTDEEESTTTDAIYIMICVFVTSFGISCAFVQAYSTGAKIFPALFLGTALAVSNIFSRVATTLSPMIAEIDKPVPLIFLCSIALLGIGVSFFLRIPEDKEQLTEAVIEKKEGRSRVE